MKKDYVFRSIQSNESRIKIKAVNLNLIDYWKKGLRLLALTLTALIACTTMARAQSDEPPDITSQFQQDKTELRHDRKMVREVREEKEEIRELNNIPEAVSQKFKDNFSKAQNVAWSAPEGFYEVDFTLKNKPESAYYDYNGHLIGIGHFLTYGDLPAKARKRIARDYKGYTPVRTMFYDDNEDNYINMLVFEQPIDRDSYITELKKGKHHVVLQIDTDGEVSLFSTVK